MPDQIVWCVDATRIDSARIGHTHVITDPPYAPRVHAQMLSAAQSGQGKPGTRKRSAGFAHLSNTLQEAIAVAAGQAQRWSLVYSDIQSTWLWELALARHIRTVPVLQENDEITGGGVVGDLPWIRWSMPQLSADRPPSGCEMIVLGHAPGKMRWRGPGNLTHLAHKCLRGLSKHPTEKPLDQMLDLVSWFTDPGDLVYDPCAGRGTTGVACALLQRGFVGCELDENEAALANERIQNAQLGLLSERDLERFRRWLASMDLEVMTPGCIALEKGRPQ